MADAAVDPPVVQDTAAADETVSTPVKNRVKVKTTKTTTPKAKASVKVKKTSSDLHPKYSQMIHEAICMLKDRHGTSRQAIHKYIKANYNVLQDDKVVNNHIKMSLRAGVKSGKLKQCKGSGACGSYKLGENAAKKTKSEQATKSPKANLTKVKKPKDVTAKKAKASPKKTKANKTDKSSKKAKSPAKKEAKSPKKTPAKKAVKSPKKAEAKKNRAKKTPTKKAAKSPKKVEPKVAEPATAAPTVTA